MYVSDSRRTARNPEAIARAYNLLRMQTAALRLYEEGLTQRASAERLSVSRGYVERLLVKLELINRGERD